MRRSLSRWLGVAIRERRQGQRLSQEELGARADLHRTYISMVERATRNISVDALDSVAEALGVRPSQLLQQAERLRDGKARP